MSVNSTGLDDAMGKSRVASRFARSLSVDTDVDTKIYSRVTSAASSPKCSTVTDHSTEIESLPSCLSEDDLDWNKEKALELQQKLLESFTSASFQLKLHELGRTYRATKGTDRKARQSFKQLVRNAQFEVIPEYGFPCSDEGVEQMIQAFETFQHDPDIFVNSTIIKEALFSESQYPDIDQENDFEFAATVGSKPRTKMVVVDLLQSLLVRFADPAFQEEVENLKLEADRRAGRILIGGFGEPVMTEDPDGYYHLPGRQELALDVQADVLPGYGFEGNRKGVREMVCHCAPYLQDFEVRNLFDSINMKLGMTLAAAERFRKLVQEIEGTPMPLIGLGRANASPTPPSLFNFKQ